MGWLLADIGGTNTRCAVGTRTGSGLHGVAHIRAFKNADYPSLTAVLRAYLAELPADERPDRGVLAVAAPLVGDEVRMINIHWQFSAAGLRAELGLSHVELMNDFTALAHALPRLTADELVQVGGEAPRPRTPKVVLGPGTGLGTGALVPVGARHWQAVSAEGGHVTLAAATDEEARLIGRARERFGHCSAERLTAGPGLVTLHELMHGETIAAEELTKRATAGDPAANATLHVGFRFLATVAGNLALSFGAFGGVYIGGGVVPRNLPSFLNSGFRDRFEDKGRYRDYLAPIPVYVIVAPYPALAGLAAYTDLTD